MENVATYISFAITALTTLFGLYQKFKRIREGKEALEGLDVLTEAIEEGRTIKGAKKIVKESHNDLVEDSVARLDREKIRAELEAARGL